jgi:hypothetical protein
MRSARSVVGSLTLVLVMAAQSSAFAAQPCSGPHTCIDLGGMSCERDLEDFLRTAEVIDVQDIGDGITNPKRVTLRKDGRECRAIFKTVDITSYETHYTSRLESVFTDKYHYEVAAYRLDRMLGIGLVPVTVVREINGETGSLQHWIENSIKMQDAVDRGISVRDMDLLMQRLMLMYVLDAMIFNIDRNFTNILVRPAHDHFFLIDHSRSFRTYKKLPDLKEERPIPVPETVAEGLQQIDVRVLEQELDGLLSKKQIRAIDKRRQLLIAELSGRGLLPKKG